MRWNNLFAFTSDSIGYAATNDLRSDKYIISRTTDRGRTWEQQYSARGKCLVLKSYEDKVYYSSEYCEEGSDVKSEIGFIDNGRNKNILSNIKGRVYSINVFNDSTVIYAHDVSFQKEYRGVDEISDSIYLSTDAGKTWKSLYADLKKVKVHGYDSSGVYMTGYFEDPSKWFLVVSDVNTGSRRIYDTGYVYKAFVDDGLLMKNAQFYKCNDNVKRISDYFWNGYGLMKYGQYNPRYFAKSGEIAFAYASQFPGKEHRTECIFYSTDSGHNWEALSIGDGLIRDGLIQSSVAKMPVEAGLSVIYQDYSDSLRIINICPEIKTQNLDL